MKKAKNEAQEEEDLKGVQIFSSLKKTTNRVKCANLMTFTLLTFIFIRPKKFRRGILFPIKHLIF